MKKICALCRSDMGEADNQEILSAMVKGGNYFQGDLLLAYCGCRASIHAFSAHFLPNGKLIPVTPEALLQGTALRLKMVRINNDTKLDIMVQLLFEGPKGQRPEVMRWNIKRYHTYETVLLLPLMCRSRAFLRVTQEPYSPYLHYDGTISALNSTTSTIENYTEGSIDILIEFFASFDDGAVRHV